LLNWFQSYQTPTLKYADYVKKKQIFLNTCAVTVNILSKSNNNFLLKILISVIFLTNFSSAKSIDFMLWITKIFKMSFRKSRVASAAFLTRFSYIYSGETKWRLLYKICHCKIDSSGSLSLVICPFPVIFFIFMGSAINNYTTMDYCLQGGLTWTFTYYFSLVFYHLEHTERQLSY
jgi:hypothetical protein